MRPVASEPDSAVQFSEHANHPNEFLAGMIPVAYQHATIQLGVVSTQQAEQGVTGQLAFCGFFKRMGITHFLSSLELSRQRVPVHRRSDESSPRTIPRR